MTRAALLRKLKALEACTEAVAWLIATKHKTLQAAWDACERPDWMLWLLHKLGADEKLMVNLACDCAETALPIWLKRFPDDDRPANAIRTARAWTQGKATRDDCSRAAGTAWAAEDAGTAWAAEDAGAAWARGAAWAAWAAWAAGAAGTAWAAGTAGAAGAARAAEAARLKANKHMAMLIRKRVPNPERTS